MTFRPAAVVTGGASGIGAATAARMRTAGWTIHVLDRNVIATSDGPADGAGPARFTHPVDITDLATLSDIAASIGPIDALVTAAGVNLRPDDGPVDRLSLDAWHRTLDVNLTGTMLTVRAFLPTLTDGGAVVTVGSTAGLAATPGVDAYTASKGAIIALTRVWASDFARFGIRVNCVCPGNTDTPLLDGILAGIPDERRGQTPQQRTATADEVAEVIAFLASSAPSYLSGAIIPVDGGATAHLAGVPFARRRAPRTGP
ncbi:NAD(P)-dependent dehydrogenase (short-subunit alcohol dehydrogenase family) [Mycobacterium sp. MAA66]|uniref:SDR family NAD(P)-dependent oxidoreductase n=1 Tax=Mycobacterium sp. MAA66 TaxID=3156297 RepID=UPI003512F743